MKTLKNYIVLIALIVFSNLNASTKTDKIAKEMSNSPEVIKLLKNSIALSMYNKIPEESKSNLPKDLLEKKQKIEEETLNLRRYVNTKFTDYNQLSEDDKLITINTIMYNSPAIISYWDCVKNTFKSLAVALGITGTLATTIFVTCALTAVGGDATAVVGTGGAAAPAVAEAIVPEITICANLAKIGGTIAVIDLGAFVTQIFSCATNDDI